MKHLRSSLFGVLAVGLALSAFPSSARADDGDDDDDTAEAADDEGDASSVEIEDTDPSAVVIFRSKLTPYGSWIDHPVYGTIWVPNHDVVGDDFAPYVSSGHWALTDDGDWMWVSQYDWGYIPFHYGRWVWVSGTGWAWIPGRVYAPAWVVWRTGDAGYLGWAPMPPAYYWVDGYAVGIWAVPPAAFVFCRTTYVFRTDVRTYVVHDRSEVHTAASGTHGYHSAHPTGGHHQHTAASPTLGEAGVKGKDAPKNRVKGDPRALHYMDKSVAKPSAPNSHASSKFAGTRSVRTTNGIQKHSATASVDRRDIATLPTVRKTSRARRVAPIVGQRVDAARTTSRDAANGTVSISKRRSSHSSTGASRNVNVRPSVGNTQVSRPSNDAPSSMPRPLPSAPRAGGAHSRGVPSSSSSQATPAPATPVPVRRGAPSRGHRR